MTRSDGLPLVQRTRVYAALGDVHRLAIVDALVLSDRSPTELAASVGIRSNLLAHHLTVLQRAGLIESIRSEGDHRRRYVRLRRESRAFLTPLGAVAPPQTLLFVCSANSARSPLAAAMWRQSSSIPARSAGTRPASRLHPLALAAGLRHGLELNHMKPQSLDALEIAPDWIVAVCDEAYEVLCEGEMPPQVHWSIPDPARRGGRRAFEDIIHMLRERIEDLRAAFSAQVE